MKSKTIKIMGCNTCDEVSLSILRDNEGNDYVSMTAWHKHPGGGHYIQQIDLWTSEDNDMELLERIIDDISLTTAEHFAKSYTL